MLTATGTALCVALLLPSWPLVSRPQQYAAPVLSSAQVLLPPATIWVRVRPASTPPVYTGTGEVLLMVEPSPSWPLLLLPQQYAAPDRIMHACALPAAIRVARDDAAAAAAGPGPAACTATQRPAVRDNRVTAVT